MIFKVAFDRFYIVMYLSVHIDLDAAKIKMFKVERVAIVGSVKGLITNHRDNDSARNLAGE